MDYPEELRISNDNLSKLLQRFEEIGYQRCREDYCIAPRYISLNKAYVRFGKTTVNNWMKEGKIEYQTEGNGKNSTKKLELSKLLLLEASKTIVIRKPYISKKVA